jgi:tetratricopeptide (TPR) repeat protein
MKRFPESIAEANKAMACNPFSPRISQHLGYVLYCQRSFSTAAQQYRKAIQLDPGDASVHEALGDAYEQEGHYEAAMEAWSQSFCLTNDSELAGVLGIVRTKQAFQQAQRVVAAKRLMRLQQQRKRGVYVPAIKFAREHLRARQMEDALTWLALACRERNVYSLLMARDPIYDPLRADRRFMKLIRQMKLGG